MEKTTGMRRVKWLASVAHSRDSNQINQQNKCNSAKNEERQSDTKQKQRKKKRWNKVKCIILHWRARQ